MGRWHVESAGYFVLKRYTPRFVGSCSLGLVATCDLTCNPTYNPANWTYVDYPKYK